MVELKTINIICNKIHAESVQAKSVICYLEIFQVN